MDITFCYEHCPIGRAASDKFLAMNASAIDAAFDFQYFTKNCLKTCQYKQKHENIKAIERVNYESNCRQE